MPQVRAETSEALSMIQAGGMPSPQSAADTAARALMVADIKRFLERPIDPVRTPMTYDAPPGAPIGDAAMDWLLSPSWCAWDRDLSLVIR
jgi:hypothetical protein